MFEVLGSRIVLPNFIPLTVAVKIDVGWITSWTTLRNARYFFFLSEAFDHPTISPPNIIATATPNNGTFALQPEVLHKPQVAPGKLARRRPHQTAVVTSAWAGYMCCFSLKQRPH